MFARVKSEDASEAALGSHIAELAVKHSLHNSARAHQAKMERRMTVCQCNLSHRSARNSYRSVMEVENASPRVPSELFENLLKRQRLYPLTDPDRSSTSCSDDASEQFIRVRLLRIVLDRMIQML